MNTAILWVKGDQGAVDRVLIQTKATPNKVWRKGDARLRNAVHEDSGFSIRVAEAGSPREMCDEVREMLGHFDEATIHFQGINFSTELSIGVTTGDSTQFVAVVDFSPDDLLLIGSLGIRLSIAAYPCSDDGERASDLA